MIRALGFEESQIMNRHYSYAIWEKIQEIFNQKIKATGHRTGTFGKKLIGRIFHFHVSRLWIVEIEMLQRVAIGTCNHERFVTLRKV